MVTKQISLQTGRECTPQDLSELTDLEFAVYVKPWRYGIEVYVRGKNFHLSADKKYIVSGFALKEYIPLPEEDPSFCITHKSAQQLMDELWMAGIRPSEQNLPPASTSQAIKDHLSDMRKIAFKFMYMEDQCTT